MGPLSLLAVQHTTNKKQKSESGTWFKSSSYSVLDSSTSDLRSASASASHDVKLLQNRKDVVNSCCTGKRAGVGQSVMYKNDARWGGIQVSLFHAQWEFLKSTAELISGIRCVASSQWCIFSMLSACLFVLYYLSQHLVSCRGQRTLCVGLSCKLFFSFSAFFSNRLTCRSRASLSSIRESLNLQKCVCFCDQLSRLKRI